MISGTFIRTQLYPGHRQRRGGDLCPTNGFFSVPIPTARRTKASSRFFGAGLCSTFLQFILSIVLMFLHAVCSFIVIIITNRYWYSCPLYVNFFFTHVTAETETSGTLHRHIASCQPTSLETTCVYTRDNLDSFGKTTSPATPPSLSCPCWS